MRTNKGRSSQIISWSKNGAWILVFILLSEVVVAQSVPLSFNYQGRAFDTDGTSPLLRTVGIKIQIRSGNGACLLYEEQQNSINLSSSNGYFTINIGSSLGDGKRTSDDPSLSMSRIFSNTGSVRSSGSDCVGGYSPASGDKRRLRVTIIDNGTSVTLSPDQEILSSPYAMVAETLQGVSASGFIQVSGAVTQASLEEIVGKKSELLSLAANESVLSALASGTSNLYLRPSAGGVNLSGAGNISLSAQKSLQLGSYTSSQQGVFVAGLTTSDKGKTWFNSDTNMVMYWDGVNVKAVGSATAMTSLNGSTQVVQSLAVSSSGVSPGFVTDASAGVHTLNLPLASTSGVMAGLLSNAEYTALSSKTYVDSKLGGETLPKPTSADDGKALRWNNTSHAWEYYSPLSGAVTSVVASQPLAITGTAVAPQLALSLGTGLSLNGNGELVPDFGTTAGKVAAGDDSRITGAFSASAFNSAVSPASSCTTAQTVYWNSVSGAFACANISIAGTQIGSGVIEAQRLPAASGSADGIVTQTAQTLAGVKTFSNDAVFNSKVGVGVASPTEKLEVSGGIKVGNSASTCNSGAAGTIRWTGTTFQGCDGSSWITLSGGGGSASVKWSELYTGSGDGVPFRISTQTISGWSGVLQVSNNRIAWVESANSTIYFVDVVNGVSPSLAFSQSLSFADGIGGPQVGLLDSSRLVYWSANAGHNLAQVIQIGASSASMGSAHTDGLGMDQYFVKSAFFPTGTANRGLSFFVNCGGGNGTAYTRWVNFSGTTVSSFSPYVSIGSCGGVSQSFIVSESKVLVPFGGSLLLIDVTGTQPTVATTAVSGASSMSVAQLSSSQYLVHYATSGGGQYLVMATVSGGTVTLGTPLPTTLGGIGQMAGLSSTEAVGTYSVGGVNYFYIADISSSTPQVTLGPIATGLGSASVWRVFSIGTGDRFAIAYQNPSDNYPYLKVFKRQ